MGGFVLFKNRFSIFTLSQIAILGGQEDPCFILVTIFFDKLANGTADQARTTRDHYHFGSRLFLSHCSYFSFSMESREELMRSKKNN